MTGAQIKAWRLERKIGMRDWCIILKSANFRPMEVSYAETNRWPIRKKDWVMPSWYYQRNIATFIKGYEAAEKKQKG